MTDPIADMLTRIRNGQAAGLNEVKIPHSKLKENIAGILKQEGYVKDVAVEGKNIKSIQVKLKYQGRKGVIEGLSRISSPGLRRYVGSGDIPRVKGGLGIAILSTSSGIMTGVQARRKNVGGELLAYVW